MAGVVSFGGLEPWFINGWGYRLLMERAVNEEIDEACSLRLVAVSLQRALAASADPYEQSTAERFALLVSRLDQMLCRLRDRNVDAISAQIAHEDASLLRRLGET